MLSTTGMELPPLVTANPTGTAAAEVGVLGARSTRLLLGNEEILNEARRVFVCEVMRGSGHAAIGF
ncbi:MAG: BBP7 family outer membrane beta-barrel protein [Pirellulaceae bacterium]